MVACLVLLLARWLTSGGPPILLVSMVANNNNNNNTSRIASFVSRFVQCGVIVIGASAGGLATFLHNEVMKLASMLKQFQVFSIQIAGKFYELMKGEAALVDYGKDFLDSCTHITEDCAEFCLWVVMGSWCVLIVSVNNANFIKSFTDAYLLRVSSTDVYPVLAFTAKTDEEFTAQYPNFKPAESDLPMFEAPQLELEPDDTDKQGSVSPVNQGSCGSCGNPTPAEVDWCDHGAARWLLLEHGMNFPDILTIIDTTNEDFDMRAPCLVWWGHSMDVMMMCNLTCAITGAYNAVIHPNPAVCFAQGYTLFCHLTCDIDSCVPVVEIGELAEFPNIECPYCCCRCQFSLVNLCANFDDTCKSDETLDSDVDLTSDSGLKDGQSAMGKFMRMCATWHGEEGMILQLGCYAHWTDPPDHCECACTEEQAAIVDSGRDFMGEFMDKCVTEPNVAKLPFMMGKLLFMIASSKWNVVQEALRWVDTVNSVSLKVREELFLEQTSFCQRSYPEFHFHGFDFVNATAEIKRTCTCVSFSARLSCCSFSSRGLHLPRSERKCIGPREFWQQLRESEALGSWVHATWPSRGQGCSPAWLLVPTLADILVCKFDSDPIDGQSAMGEFLRICITWHGDEGLMWVQGKSIVMFDYRALTIATGLFKHSFYGIDFVKVVAEIAKMCPCVSFSDGLSKPLLSFQGLDLPQDAKHSVSLHHAMPFALNMFTVNLAGMCCGFLLYAMPLGLTMSIVNFLHVDHIHDRITKSATKLEQFQPFPFSDHTLEKYKSFMSPHFEKSVKIPCFACNSEYATWQGNNILQLGCCANWTDPPHHGECACTTEQAALSDYGKATEDCVQCVFSDNLDLTCDADSIDDVSTMGEFMERCVTEPNVTKLLFMMDYSEWNIVEEGLTWVQGRNIVKSLNVDKNLFLEQAKTCNWLDLTPADIIFDCHPCEDPPYLHSCGAKNWDATLDIAPSKFSLEANVAKLPFLIDFPKWNIVEEGSTWIRGKNTVNSVLRQKVDSAPEGMIFDCHVLTIATGLPQRNSCCIDFINAVAEIRRKCSRVSFSGELSNLSFSFRHDFSALVNFLKSSAHITEGSVHDVFSDKWDLTCDADLIDGASAMGKFMEKCVTEPNVAKLPSMMDSSEWNIVEAGLTWVQGRNIVNRHHL